MRMTVAVVFLLTASIADAAGRAPSSAMSFFVTSDAVKSGNLGGLSGADRICQTAAAKAGAGGRQWRAYLSLQADNGHPGVNARDRIGLGPWVNANGDFIARNGEELHEMARTLWQITKTDDPHRNNISRSLALTETGEPISGSAIVLTGSRADGTAFAIGRSLTCRNWTSDARGDAARIGHLDRKGDGTDPTSWNSADTLEGCAGQSFAAVPGGAHLYCFAAR